MRKALRSMALALVPLLGGLAWTAAAGAAAWPGAPPCNGTLQACIDGLPAGSVIQMSNSIADESLTISKSLTLEAAPGKSGVIGGTSTPREIQVGDGTADGKGVVVQIRDLILDNAVVSVFLDTDSGHQVTIHGCTIREQPSYGDAIDLDVRVPASVTVEYNDVQSDGDGIYFYTGLTSGTALATFLGNRITAVTPSLSANGIDLDLRSSGRVDASVFSNLIHGVTGCNCGGAAGVQVRLSDTVSASIDIVNNTLDDLQVASDGIDVYQPVGPTASVAIFNNIVTRATQSPVSLPALTQGLLVTSGYNDFFDNTSPAQYGGYPTGAGVVSVDPQYTNTTLGDYHLQDTSPVIDAGASLRRLPPTDADGKPRKIGAAPDLGAFEAPEPAAAAAAGAACAALATVAAGRRGRRQRSA